MIDRSITNTIANSLKRSLSLILAMVMLAFSSTTAIALDALNELNTLAEQEFVLAPENGVELTLSGMMPVGGSAEAEPADVDGEDILYAYDITIFYANGWEFEPADDQPITVSVKSDAIAQAIDDEDTVIEIEHITDSGIQESVELTSAEDGEAVFDAGSFSIYLIKTHSGNDENLMPRRTYHFLSPNYEIVENRDNSAHYRSAEYRFPNKLNEMVSTQTITDGESLHEIVLPENNNSGLFYGWYQVHFVSEENGIITYYWGSDGPHHVPFNEPIEVDDEDDTDVYLAPLYGHYRFLTFHQDVEGSENANTIVTRKLITLGEDRKCTLSISDVRAPSTNPNRIVFWGWKYTHADSDELSGTTEVIQTVNADGTEIPETITIHDANVINGSQPSEEQLRHMIFDIWPVFREARWIEFDSNGDGATYRSSQFIMLDEPPTSFNNAPERAGYEFQGWYYEKTENGVQTKIKVTDEYSNIIIDSNFDITTGVRVEDGHLVMTRESDEQIFRAEWLPAATAGFHVIVWKQKITDDKNAEQADRTYDFDGYYPDARALPLTGNTGQDPRETEGFLNYYGTGLGFQNLNESHPTEYKGFHYSYTLVNDDGLNDSDGVINPDGSTIVNVYYDRDLMTVTYHYKETQLDTSALTTVGDYAYYVTDDEYGEIYGLVNGNYVPLTVTSAMETAVYVFSNRYTQSNEELEDMYGVTSGTYPEYYLLNRVTNYSWTKSGDVYTPYTGDDTSGTYYGIHDNAFNNDITYARYWTSWRWQYSTGWLSSTAYNGVRYTHANNGSGSYTGDIYVISGQSLVQTNDFTGNGPFYGMDSNGVVYALSKSISYSYTLRGAAYTGQRYTSEMGYDGYTGTRYVKENGVFTAVAANDHSQDRVYGIRNGVYELLTKHDSTMVYTYEDPNGNAYTGTLYNRYHVTNDATFKYEDVWTGLYGQDYLMYGYDWPTDFRWTEGTSGGTGQTLLSVFNSENTATQVLVHDYHLYCQGAAPSDVIIHCRQMLDGTYSLETEYIDEAHINYNSNLSSATVTFNFSDKFTGFHVASYDTSFKAEGGSNAVSDGSTAIFTKRNTYYIYHQRVANLEFRFDYNYNGDSRVIGNIKYERNLSDLNSPAYDPPARPHFTFGGWYEDKLCTVPFDFNIKMPAANKIVYAKWTPIKYRVEVDPNGGEFPLGGGSATYFNVEYDELVGEYAGIRRSYVEDDDQGTYVYANFQYAKVSTFPGVTKLEAVFRKAFYINIDDINSSYTAPFTVNGVTYRYSETGMTLEEYKSCIDMSKRYSPVTDGVTTYRLVSWHKVRADGSEEQTPFNFYNHLSENTMIRARWVQLGKYSLTYSPTMTSTGISGTMARYNDPLESDRKFADKAPVVILQEPTNLFTTGMGGQHQSAENYIFRGWEPLEDGVFYDPGDIMTLDARFAGPQGVIHMEAYYEKLETTIRRVDYTSLILDANDTNAQVNSLGLSNDKYEYADFDNNQIRLERRDNNFAVDLSNYAKNFTNDNGHMLLGWNTTPDADDYIPEYYADAVVGVNKENMPNILYAVWEPMVYLTIRNTTTKTVSFVLELGYDGVVYEGHTNAVTGLLERRVFSENDYVDKTDIGRFVVDLAAGTEVKLVLPDGANASYSVSGSYIDNTDHKALVVYNSGSQFSTTIEYYGGKWYKNDTALNTTSPIEYSTSGTVTVGPLGKLVMFSEEDPEVALNLSSRYYDIENEEWTDCTVSAGPQDDAHFILPDRYTPISFGSTSMRVKMIHENENVTFSLEVSSYDTENYKFIGWYNTDSAEPNQFSLDGESNGPGSTLVSGLTVPADDTNYYALFVPYAAGDLYIEHREKADTAGHCADDRGLSLRVQYSGVDTTDYGDKDNAAEYTIPSTYIYEKNTSGSVTITVGATPHDGSIYDSTYRDTVRMIPDENLKAVYTASVPELFADSPTVKGLKVLNPLRFYSVFSRGYTITYRYTARNGEEKTYVLTGSADTFDDFGLFVIEHTPFERNLTGEIIWDTQDMDMEITEYGMVAELREKDNIRAKRRVTIITESGYEPFEMIEYGETFTEEQAALHAAPETNSLGQQFEYWDIVNSDTHEHIANCYNREFTFAVWNNYTITPHYSDSPSTIHDEGQFITIDYIDTSRNQWGSIEYGVRDITDKLVVDFDISFIDNGRRIYDAFDENNEPEYDLGVIFELCGNTDDGTFDPTDYTENTAAARSRAADVIGKAGATGTGTDMYSGVKTGYYYSKIDIGIDTVSKFNRSEFARSFTTSSVKNRVFRVYAYMKTPEGNIVLSDPKYMSVYDFASPEYAIIY